MATFPIEIAVAVGTVLDGLVLERFVDSNGCPAERRLLGGQEVVVHYDDLPDSDRDVVDGIPCTSALRTVIDIAASVDEAHLERILLDALDRELFTIDEGEEEGGAAGHDHPPGRHDPPGAPRAVGQAATTLSRSLRVAAGVPN